MGRVMPEVKLTERRIRDLPTPIGKAYERYWDTEISGLGVKVLESGKKVYVFKDRLNGKTIWAKGMPRCSETSLAEIRDEALQWKVQIRKGENPWKRTEQVKQHTLIDLCVENLEAMESRTHKKLSEQHLKDCRLSTNWIRQCHLGNRSLVDISVAEAELFLRNFSPRRAEHLRGWLRNCYNFAINRSYVPLGFNPWKFCEKKYVLPDPEELPRCSDAEIATIADYLRFAEGNASPPVCSIWIAHMWFLIRTGSRPSDARNIQRQSLKKRKGCWVIDRYETKTGRKTMVLPENLGLRLAGLSAIPGDDSLFPSVTKKKFYREYSAMRRATGLSKTPYAIRRWFACTGRIAFDGDIEPVQHLCGWESKEIAERYAGESDAYIDALIVENAATSQTINSHIDKVIGS